MAPALGGPGPTDGELPPPPALPSDVEPPPPPAPSRGWERSSPAGAEPPPPPAAPPPPRPTLRRGGGLLAGLISGAVVLALLAGLILWSPWSGSNPEQQAGPTPGAPAALRADHRTADAVVIHWSAGNGPRVKQFEVVRNGETIGEVAGSKRAYQDRHLAPATTYRYRVVAVGEGGRSAPSPVLEVTTVAPPVAEARLAGRWPVHIVVLETPGGTVRKGERDTESWEFTPACHQGACAVRLAGELWSHPFTARLARSGGVYTGTATAHISHCGSNEYLSTDVTNELTFRVKVRTAGPVHGHWGVRSFTGTMRLDSPSTSGTLPGEYCPAQTITTSLAAHR